MRYGEAKRTTVTLDAHLLQDVKQRAAKQAVTLSEYVEESLRIRILKQAEPSGPIVFHTIPGGHLQPGVNINNNASLQEILDEGVPIEKLR
ncbi:MAG: hypothetical protein JHC87_01540 [Thermoleophilaceae bacterium]|nr:hypothetical protein [Thermoleophilaceae bacterium]